MPLAQLTPTIISSAIDIPPGSTPPLISLSDVTPSTADIVLIINDEVQSLTDNTQLNSSQNLVLTSSANDNISQGRATLILSTPENDNSPEDDVFLAPAPKATLTKLSDVRNVRHTQKTYGKTSSSNSLLINSTEMNISVSSTTPTPQVKSTNQNSLLKALISRPCMKIPTTIQIPVVGSPQASLIRKPAKKSTSKAKKSGIHTVGRTTFVRAASSTTPPVRAGGQSEFVFDVTAASTIATTTSVTSFAISTITTTASLYTDSATLTPFATTATLITISSPTVTQSAPRTFATSAPIIQRGLASTPILIPFSASLTSHMVSKNTSQLATARSLTTATLTSFTNTNTNTSVKIVSDNLITTVPKDTTRVTYATRVRNPPSAPTVLTSIITPIAASSPTLVSVTSTVTSATARPVKTTTPESPFLEPLPVTKSRTTPATRTFSGPRKVTLTPRMPHPGGVQRFFIRHTNPRAFVDKLLKTPAPLHKIADAAVTRLHYTPQVINVQHSEPSSSFMPIVTTNVITTHTLVVPHYKDTVFKNLSSISSAARLGPTSSGPQGPTERIVIRRPVAYFSPRRSFPCISASQSSATLANSQGLTRTTLYRAVPVSLADNRTHILRSEFINVPQNVISSENFIVQTPPGLNVKTISPNINVPTTTSS